MIRFSRCSSFLKDETDTTGFMIVVELFGCQLEIWLTKAS
jgi:hypothetical protein